MLESARYPSSSLATERVDIVERKTACPFHKLDRAIFELPGARREATMASVAVGGTLMADSDTTSDEERVGGKETPREVR